MMELTSASGLGLTDEPVSKRVAVYRPKMMGSVFGGSSAAEALEMEMDVHNGILARRSDAF